MSTKNATINKEVLDEIERTRKIKLLDGKAARRETIYGILTESGRFRIVENSEIKGHGLNYGKLEIIPYLEKEVYVELCQDDSSTYLGIRRTSLSSQLPSEDPFQPPRRLGDLGETYETLAKRALGNKAVLENMLRAESLNAIAKKAGLSRFPEADDDSNTFCFAVIINNTDDLDTDLIKRVSNTAIAYHGMINLPEYDEAAEAYAKSVIEGMKTFAKKLVS